MIIAEERFYTSVPQRLSNIERQLERMNDNIEQLIEVLTKILEKS